MKRTPCWHQYSHDFPHKWIYIYINIYIYASLIFIVCCFDIASDLVQPFDTSGRGSAETLYLSAALCLLRLTRIFSLLNVSTAIATRSVLQFSRCHDTNEVITYLAMNQYLLIPFLEGWTSINPSYFDVNYRGTIGFDPLPYSHELKVNWKGTPG